jgi:D-3-phosphoglycerate dehydrogenase
VGEATIVAILGTRFADFSVEEAVLGPRGARLVGGRGATPDEIIAAAAGAAVILAGSTTRFDAGVIARLSCAGIVRYGVGVESIDLRAASSAGMWVAYVPDYGTEAVATHSVALLLAALRRIVAADRAVKSGEWGIDGLRPLAAPASLTVGIVGAGRIGRRVAELLAPFGFELVAHDPYVDVGSSLPGVKPVSLDELLEVSDVVTLHAPGSPQGVPLLGPVELDRLKRGAVIVNTARGSLIDQDSLIEGLSSGAIAGAALDVFEDEPPGTAFAKVADRTVLTPHMAWYTEQSEVELRTKAAHEALRLLDGLPPVNIAAGPEARPPGSQTGFEYRSEGAGVATGAGELEGRAKER